MKTFVYFIELITTFFAVWLLNIGLNKIYQKKLNPLLASIFTFLTIGFLGFLFTPYLMSFPHPFLMYLPIAIIFFILNLVKIIKSSP